jgi:RNA polymerase sigma-70 factor (ECF subfamily)
MTTDELELSLIQRAAAGDSAALECLLFKYRTHLLNYVSRRLPEDLRRILEPEDILQDVYFEAFRRIGGFTAVDSHSALRWMVTIARNRVVHVIRMQRTLKRGGSRGPGLGDGLRVGDSLVLLLQDLVVYERTPSRSAAAHELMLTLQQSINRLPPDYRQAVRLRYMENLSLETVAERMSRTSGAVRMLCARGLKSLRIDMRSASLFV